MLRIIAGEFRSRHLETPPDGQTTRPLPDRVRVALFNMLHGHLEGQSVFDVFAGTGSFGLEALSRGAAEAVMVEKERAVVKLIERNIASLGVESRASVFQGDALGAAALSRCPRPVHVIFFDPPYPMMEDPALRPRVLDQFARCVAMLDDTGFAILRTPWPFVEHEHIETDNTDDEGQPIIKILKKPLELTVPGAKGPETHPYGSTALHWFMKKA